MPSAVFNNRSEEVVPLSLTLLNETTLFVDFHKRPETTYNDLTVDDFDMPFVKLIKRDGSTVYLTSEIDPGTGDVDPDIDPITGGFTQLGTIKNTNENAGYEPIVTPDYAGDTRKYDFSTLIQFNNSFSTTTEVEMISGTIPEGLTLDTGLTSNNFISFSGNIKDELFGLSLDDYRDLHIQNQQNQTTVFMGVEYIDNLVDKNVITNPSSTFSAGDRLYNVGESSTDNREIESVERYVDSDAIVTNDGSFISGTEYLITFVGNTNFTAIGASATPAVGEIFTATGVGGDGTGKATSEIKLKVKIKTYISKSVNTGGEYIEIYEPFMASQKRKFALSTMIEEPIDDDWRGYVTTVDVNARYEDVMYENTTTDLFSRRYDFTLGLRETIENKLVETKDFNITIHASPEALRNRFEGGKGIQIQRYINVDVH